MRILLATLLFFTTLLPAAACFGPKLYIGSVAGEEGELLFHLAAIYIHEKTGVDSIRLEMTAEQTPTGLLQAEEVDLVFSVAPSQDWQSLLQVGNQLQLLSGPRPTDDLQFTTVPRALAKLQRLLNPADLAQLQEKVAAGTLPAKAVRQLFMQRGWI